MPVDPIRLPQGYRLAPYKTLDSTNTEALRLAEENPDGDLWIWAREQTAGKGRLDRSWQSLQGNLSASLLLFPSCEPSAIPQLGFVMGNAIHDAVSDLLPPACLMKPYLKWPNDLLLNAGKTAGILLESRGTAVVIGVGLNIAASPRETGQPTASLADSGVSATPETALSGIADHFAKWRMIWKNGAGFDATRSAWLDRSLPVGSRICVHIGPEKLKGTFAGLHKTGALLLETDKGEQKCITAGDVFQL